MYNVAMTSHCNFRLYHATTRSRSPPRTTVWPLFSVGQKSAYYTHPSSIPKWRINTGINIDKCIVPGCSITSDSGLIIHTGLVSTQQVASLLGIPLPQTSEGKLTALCQGHYKHIHRLLHADDSMYKHEKCFTCNVILKGPS